MKRILIGWMAALSALLCACSAQTVWETVDGGCVPAEGGAAYAIRIALPQDAVEEVFAERGARQIYTQPGRGYEITTEILDAAPAAAIVRRLSGFDASALHVYKRQELQRHIEARSLSPQYIMATRNRLELSTSSVTGWRANRLHHRAK